jgi:hypothetical protein
MREIKCWLLLQARISQTKPLVGHITCKQKSIRDTSAIIDTSASWACFPHSPQIFNMESKFSETMKDEYTEFLVSEMVIPVHGKPYLPQNFCCESILTKWAVEVRGFGKVRKATAYRTLGNVSLLFLHASNAQDLIRERRIIRYHLTPLSTKISMDNATHQTRLRMKIQRRECRISASSQISWVQRLRSA